MLRTERSSGTSGFDVATRITWWLLEPQMLVACSRKESVVLRQSEVNHKQSAHLTAVGAIVLHLNISDFEL